MTAFCAWNLDVPARSAPGPTRRGSTARRSSSPAAPRCRRRAARRPRSVLREKRCRSRHESAQRCRSVGSWVRSGAHREAEGIDVLAASCPPAPSRRSRRRTWGRTGRASTSRRASMAAVSDGTKTSRLVEHDARPDRRRVPLDGAREDREGRPRAPQRVVREVVGDDRRQHLVEEVDRHAVPPARESVARPGWTRRRAGRRRRCRSASARSGPKRRAPRSSTTRRSRRCSGRGRGDDVDEERAGSRRPTPRGSLSSTPANTTGLAHGGGVRVLGRRRSRSRRARASAPRGLPGHRVGRGRRAGSSAPARPRGKLTEGSLLHPTAGLQSFRRGGANGGVAAAHFFAAVVGAFGLAFASFFFFVGSRRLLGLLVEGEELRGSSSGALAMPPQSVLNASLPFSWICSARHRL